MYLSQTKLNVYRFRIRIPNKYQCYFLRKELSKSLETKDIDVANLLVKKYVIAFKELIHKINIGIIYKMLTREEIDNIVKQYIADVLGRDSMARINKSSMDGLSGEQLPNGKQLDITEDLLNMYQSHLQHLSLKPVFGIANELIPDLDIEDNSHKELMFKLLQAQVTIYSEITERNKGNFKINQTFEQEANEKPIITINTALERYLKYIVGKSSANQYRDVSNFLKKIFIELIGKEENVNTDLESITEELEILRLFPRRNVHKYVNMTISELKEKLDDVLKKERISTTNYKKQLLWIRSFYSYCFDMKYIDIPIFKYIALPDGTNDLTQRLALSDEEVCKFFEATRTQPDMYLLLEVYAYTGMRTKEFFQMQIKDEMFDLSDESVKLKTKASWRKIPIPQRLVEKKNEIADLQTKYNERTASKKLNKILNEHVVNNRKKTLYSLRHSVATKLTSALVDGRIINEILGHARGTSMSEKRYADRFDINILKPYIDSINYGQGTSKSLHST